MINEIQKVARNKKHTEEKLYRKTSKLKMTSEKLLTAVTDDMTNHKQEAVITDTSRHCTWFNLFSQFFFLDNFHPQP